MRRMLQFGTLCLFLAAFLTPLTECFDRWDAPGIDNDTEFAVFALVLGLCLVLLMSKLLSVVAMLIGLVAEPHGAGAARVHGAPGHLRSVFFVPPLLLPLRI